MLNYKHPEVISMAKKPYSLDYSIVDTKDRIAAVEDILDKLPRTPNQRDLETFANYILYGKRDEKLVLEKRYNSYRTKGDHNLSFEALTDAETQLSTPSRDPYVRPAPKIDRPTYDRKGNLLSVGDSDIPGMQELWDTIDRLSHIYDVAIGKVQDASINPPTDPYRIYQLKHTIIDIKRHQFYLKDHYKPTLRFLNMRHPETQTVNFDEDSAYWVSRDELEEKIAASYNPYTEQNPDNYENIDGKYKWTVREQVFDWENPKHILALIKHYSSIYMQLWETPLAWGRTLIYDFDRYVKIANLGPVKEYIILRLIDGAGSTIIIEEIKEKFDISYSINGMSKLKNETIPHEIALAAKKVRVWKDFIDGKIKGRNCTICGKFLPLHPFWFTSNVSRKNGFGERCRECTQKLYRMKKGVDYDERKKDSYLLEVPSNHFDPPF